MNMKFASKLFIALVSALALSTAAVAGGDKDKDKLSEEQQHLMSQLDLNGDGVISETEAQREPELAQRFRELDENGNEVLETAEFARFEVTDDDTEYPEH